jgi:hypothetical protein
MDMTKKVLVVLAVAALVVTGLLWLSPRISRRATTNSSPMDNVAHFLALGQIVEDTVVRAATKSWLDRLANGDMDPSNAAAEARQEKYLADLLPNFGGDRAKLYGAEYAVWSDEGQGTAWRLKEAGLTVRTKKFLSDYRAVLFARLRDQLRDPGTFWLFYCQEKPTMLVEIIARPELRDKVRNFLDTNGHTFADVAADQDRTKSYTALFARRRMKEGGAELVRMYAWIAQDLRDSIR